MYLLQAADERVAMLRDRLGGLGDSLVVVGGDFLWNVHVHVADAGAAIEAGMAAGRPYRIWVTRLGVSGNAGEQGSPVTGPHPQAPRLALAVRATVPGPPAGTPAVRATVPGPPAAEPGGPVVASGSPAAAPREARLRPAWRPAARS